MGVGYIPLMLDVRVEAFNAFNHAHFTARRAHQAGLAWITAEPSRILAR
jgi:hypothetical protein